MQERQALSLIHTSTDSQEVEVALSYLSTPLFLSLLEQPFGLPRNTLAMILDRLSLRFSSSATPCELSGSLRKAISNSLDNLSAMGLQPSGTNFLQFVQYKPQPQLVSSARVQPITIEFMEEEIEKVQDMEDGFDTRDTITSEQIEKEIRSVFEEGGHYGHILRMVVGGLTKKWTASADVLRVLSCLTSSDAQFLQTFCNYSERATTLLSSIFTTAFKDTELQKLLLSVLQDVVRQSPAVSALTALCQHYMSLLRVPPEDFRPEGIANLYTAQEPAEEAMEKYIVDQLVQQGKIVCFLFLLYSIETLFL